MKKTPAERNKSDRRQRNEEKKTALIVTKI